MSHLTKFVAQKNPDRNGAAALKIHAGVSSSKTQYIPSTTPNPARGYPTQQPPERSTFTQQRYLPAPVENYSPQKGLGDSSVDSNFDDTALTDSIAGESDGDDGIEGQHQANYRIEHDAAQDFGIPPGGSGSRSDLPLQPLYQENPYAVSHGGERAGSKTSGRFQAAENVHHQNTRTQSGAIGGAIISQQASGSKKRNRNDVVDSNYQESRLADTREVRPTSVQRIPDDADLDEYASTSENDTHSQISQNDEPISSQNQLGPDYDDEKLGQMQYSSLQKESYDMMPDDRDPPFPDKLNLANFDDKMAYFVKLVKGDSKSANAIIRRMGVDDWEQTGDWLLAEIGKMFQQRKEARQEQRAISARIEKQLEGRYRDVQAKMDDLDDELNGMQAGAQELMRGKSPLKR